MTYLQRVVVLILSQHALAFVSADGAEGLSRLVPHPAASHVADTRKEYHRECEHDGVSMETAYAQWVCRRPLHTMMCAHGMLRAVLQYGRQRPDGSWLLTLPQAIRHLMPQ